MTNEERKDFYMNRNIKLYPTYCALTWDVLFVWTILTVYYTTVKGLSFSQAVLLDSVQTIAACIMCGPLTKLFANLKTVTATRLGNLGYIGFLLILIFGKTFWQFSIGAVCLAFAYIMCSVKNTSILNKSLRLVNRSNDYQRVYGKGVSIYYVLEAISSIAATYLFRVNAYLPFCLSLAFIVLAQIYSFLIKNPEKFQESNAIIDSKEEQAVLKAKQPDSFLKILSSGFVISLLFYALIMRGALYIDTTQLRLYLQEVTDAQTGIIPFWTFGYIFAFMRLCQGISSKYQFKFNLKFNLKSLIIFTLTFIISVSSTALVYLFMPNSILKLVIILFLMIVTCILRQPNTILLNNYMQVCTHSKNHERMYALRTIAEYLGIAIFNAIYAQLLNSFNNNIGYADLIHVGILILPMLIGLIVFIRALTKKYAQKYTIIKPEYTEDEL